MPNMSIFQSKIPLSLYIHLPWCVRKCPYCDFNSHELQQSLPEELYVKALLHDLKQQSEAIQDRQLVSIFFGGGTPSLFSPSAIESILKGVEDELKFKTDIEITLEANPGTVDESRFIGFRKAGVNRLSIGIQSLQNQELKALGRIHDRDHALRAIESAVNAGFNNFNLDLMHGLPEQTIENAMNDLKDALQFNPPHLSWYQLTIEPNTFFHHQPPALPIEDVLCDIQDQGKEKITHHGLRQYEVSAYSAPNHECVHNKNYWEFGDYLGIGAGAHSKITYPEKSIITRHWQPKNPKDYLKNTPATSSVITKEDLIFEFMLNALRLIQGVPVSLFTERTGLSIDTIASPLQIAKEKKLLVDDSSTLCATEFGQRYLNDLIGMFLKVSSTMSS